MVGAPNTAATKVTTFVHDTVTPHLDRYKLDMDEGTLALTFSEPIDASTVDPTKMTIQGLHDMTAGDTSGP